MADEMKKKYRVSGSGVLSINDDKIVVSVADKGDFNLARVLSDLNGCAIKFNFAYDEDYEETVEVDEGTGEVI